MTQLDIYYRALVDLYKLTSSNRDCVSARNLLIKSESGGDSISVRRYVCEIEEDWIEAIEKGLVFIEKAIGEERQFIRSDGEIVPIEKVKNVSRESVEHLARHSNFITREQEDNDDIIPDRLLTVERLNDYAVYENRFIYMLLCLLRDFISLRYQKILDLTTTYRGAMTMRRSVNVMGNKLDYEVRLDEEKKDDWYLRENNSAKSAINRIDLILKSVCFYLRTPLMEEVGKVAMIKPPVTKTNVLRMDKNFKGAVELYDFIVAYDRDGYSVKEQVDYISPFPDKISEEFALTALLSSFLTYEHGLKLENYLAAEYDKEEQKRREEEQIRLQEQIKALSKRVKDSGGDADEYMLMLEKRIRFLEKENAQLDAAQQEISSLRGEIESLTGRETELQEKITSLNDAITKAEAEHAYALRQAKEEFFAETDKMRAEQREEIGKAQEETRQKQRELDETLCRFEKLQSQKAFSDARLNALSKQYNLVSDSQNYTSESAFLELEMQYLAFENFFKDEWKKTKKQIRKDVLKPRIKAIFQSNKKVNGQVPPKQSEPQYPPQVEEQLAEAAAASDNDASRSRDAEDIKD